MIFVVAPKENIGHGIELPTITCKCDESVDCGFKIDIAPADYEGLEVNGVFTAPENTPADGDTLIEAVLSALVSGGARQYNSDNFEYDGTTLYFHERSTKIPTFTIAGVETQPVLLCTEVEYCEYEYITDAGAVVTIDDVTAVIDVDYTFVDGLYTVTAKRGAVVLINGEPVEACRCNIFKFEGDENSK